VTESVSVRLCGEGDEGEGTDDGGDSRRDESEMFVSTMSAPPPCCGEDSAPKVLAWSSLSRRISFTASIDRRRQRSRCLTQ
jgi:hypothetical protein